MYYVTYVFFMFKPTCRFLQQNYCIGKETSWKPTNINSTLYFYFHVHTSYLLIHNLSLPTKHLTIRMEKMVDLKVAIHITSTVQMVDLKVAIHITSTVHIFLHLVHFSLVLTETNWYLFIFSNVVYHVFCLHIENGLVASHSCWNGVYIGTMPSSSKFWKAYCS